MKKPSNHNKKRKQDYESSSCKLTYDRFRPAKEGLREALCTIGNGYFATRGAAPESSASRIHYPGTYIAGVYNKLPTHISGRTIYNEDMVNCPNPKCITNMDPQNAKFIPTFEGKEMLLKCEYCEKLFKPEELNEYVK